MRRASDSTRGGWEILRVDDPRSVRPIDPPLGAYPWGNPSDARFLDDQGLLLTLNGDQHGLVVVYEANGRARWVVQREENHLRISTLSERDGRSVAILGAEREVYEFRNGRSQLAPRYRRALMVDLLTGEVSVLPDDSLLERPASRGTEAVVELAEDGNWRWIHLRTGETRVLPIGPLAPTSAASSRSTGESASFLVPVES